MILEINDILEFWFGTETDEKKMIETQSALWWGKSQESDQVIRQQFSKIYEAAVNDELRHWLNSAKGQLALIIVLDQFSRVLHRDNAEAFAQDSKAINIALEGISKNIDKSLKPVERVFYYMPLEHSEDIDRQNHSVAMFQQLLLEVPGSLKKEFEGFLDFANRHKAIIEQFNRFPHRNSQLNRFSSAEEVAFLSEPGSSF